MIRRRLISTMLGTGLVVAGGFAATGCGGDAGQPGRESISAPRKGGGVQDTADEKIKAKATAGGKLGAKGSDL